MAATIHPRTCGGGDRVLTSSCRRHRNETKVGGVLLIPFSGESSCISGNRRRERTSVGAAFGVPMLATKLGGGNGIFRQQEFFLWMFSGSKFSDNSFPATCNVRDVDFGGVPSTGKSQTPLPLKPYIICEF